MIKNLKAVIRGGTLALALSSLLVGCAREISHTETSKVNNDGSVRTKEKTVSQSSDGTVTKTEESKSTKP